MGNASSATILLVEDNPGHARLIEKNLRRSNIMNEMIVLDDGQKAVDFLFRQGPYAGQTRPSPLVVLLDLKLPVLDGYQVLRRMKADHSTRHILVVILTTTEDPHEVAACYDLGCNIFITKPVDYEQFTETIQSLARFPLIVQIPDGE